jgi:ribosomal RNA-processing protein 12
MDATSDDGVDVVSSGGIGSGLAHPGKGTESQQRVAAILAALGDVIRSQSSDSSHSHEPTSTEYFVVIFRSLSAGNSELGEHVADMLTILIACAPTCSRAILRDQFKAVSLLISKIIMRSESSKILRLCLELLGSLLEVQDHSEGFWGGIQTLKIVNMYLGLIDDERVKIRKTVHSVLLRLLKEHRRTHSTSLSSYIGQFCTEILKSCTRSEYKRSLAVILFLENGLALLPSDVTLQIIDVALRLPSCNQPLLSAQMLKMMDSFYQSPHLSLNVPQLFECVRFLITMPPETLDMEANAYYCTAIASGLLRIKGFPDNAALPDLLVAGNLCLLRACETDFTQIHCAVATALKRLIYGYVTDAVVEQSVQVAAANTINNQQQHTYLHRFLSGVEVLLQLRYQQSWIYILDAVRTLFEVIRGNSAVTLLSSFMVKLADVNQAVETGILSVETPVALAVSDTLGAVMKSTGIVNFLNVIPFTTNTQADMQGSDIGGIDTSREWILAIMHSTLKTVPCALADFGKAILPLASQCDTMVKSPEKFNLNAFQTKQIRNRVLQLWSTFPDFVSYGCTDIPASFPRVAKIVENCLKDKAYPELLPIMITSLTHIARNAVEKASVAVAVSASAGVQIAAVGSVKIVDTPDVVRLREYTPVFIPAVLDFLETIDITDIRFQSCVTCVSTWVAVAAPQLVTAVTRKLLQLLLTSTHLMAEQQAGSSNSMNVDGAAGVTSEENIAAGWMSVLRAIIPHLTPDLVVLLYKTVRPLLSVDESLSIQKRSYHVLEGLLQVHSDVIFTSAEPAMTILGIISESLLTCHVSARNMRLRCIDTLLKSLSDEEMSLAATNLLGEVLICQRDSNQKSRLAAVILLKTFIARVSTQQMLTQLCSAIVGETTIMRSSGIVGLCILLLEKRFDATDGKSLLTHATALLSTICILLREESSEQTRAILSFIRICCASLPIEAFYAVQPDMPQTGALSTPTSPAASELLLHIIHAICVEIGAQKSKFSSRIRAIFRKLIQRVGVDILTAHVPEADMSLINYILKQNRRNYRKKLQKEKANRDEVARMLGSDSDSDSDKDDNDSDIDNKKVSITRPKAVRSKELMMSMPSSTMPSRLDNLLEDQPSSFMVAMSNSSNAPNRKKLKARRPGGSAGSTSDKGMNSVGNIKKGDDDDEEDFKVIVAADGKIHVTANSNAQTNTKNSQQVLSLAENMKQSLAKADDNEDNDDSGKHSRNNSTGKEAKKQRSRDPGEEYRAKSGVGGDVWRKGMLQPHAFIPLDPKLLSKRNKEAALTKLGVVVGGASQGFHAGASAKNKQKRGFVVGNRNQRRSNKEHK